MPGTATISKDQCDGFYELVRNHLGAIGDVWIALEENEDFATAERLGLEFGEDFRLLADIGWRPNESQEAFELTMPQHDLMEVLKRLHNEAEKLLTESPAERRSREEDEETDRASNSGWTPARKCWSSSTRERVSERDSHYEEAPSSRRA